jgi:DsbC/DsbD-like thiol-disulfide interchange protein
MIKSLLTALSICATSALPVAAQDKFDMPISGEILHGWQQADGTRMAAIKLTLAPGWKTYWRSPGDTGIPPQFDWSRSRNLGGVGITWPAPHVYREGGVVTIGYKDQLILPVTLAPRRAGAPLKLNTTLDIGVCRDICIPHRMKLKATISNTNTAPTPAIAAALAAQPYSAKEGGVRSATCALKPTADGLEITAKLTLPASGPGEVVVIEPGQPNIWMSETDVTRQGKQLTAKGDLMATEGRAIAIDRSAIKITVINGNHAVEINGCTPG